jgi:imidazolonepropionase
MIEADLVVVGISELATPQGSSPRLGPQLGRLHVLQSAAIACDGERIVFVGTEQELAQRVQLRPGGARVDGAGGTALPGFVDAHTHLPFAGWRDDEFIERLGGASYSEIAARGGGILRTVSQTRAASEEQLAQAVQTRLRQLLALGTTTVEAKSGYGLTLADELKQLRALRSAAGPRTPEIVPTFLGAHTVPAEYRGRREAYIRLLIDEALPRVAEERLAEYADAFVDAQAFSAGEARQVLQAAKGLGLGLRLHADQLADDGAAQLAAELGAASADHLEHVSQPGIEALARAGTAAVLLPAAAFFLKAEQRAPARSLIQAGVPLVVATDFNPGTAPLESMGAALGLACLTAGLSVDEAITAGTLNAACALGRGSDVGTIEPGKRADFVIHRIPNRNHLVYRFGVPRIGQVFARGQLAYAC